MSYWDQAGQKWMSDSQKPSTPNPTPSSKVETPKTEPTKEVAVTPKDTKGQVNFKRQPQQDSFQGTTGVIAKPRKAGDVAKTVGTALFGFACLAIGVLPKGKII